MNLKENTELIFEQVADASLSAHRNLAQSLSLQLPSM